MLIRSLATRKSKRSLKRLLNYLFHSNEKVRDGKGDLHYMTQHLRGSSIEEWVEEWDGNEAYRTQRRRNSVWAYHDVLSFHEKDSAYLNQAVIQDLLFTYLNKRAPGALALGVVHYDTEHIHLHLCFSGIEAYTGRSNRISKSDFARIKKEVQEFQKSKYPELMHSIVEHGKSRAKTIERG